MTKESFFKVLFRYTTALVYTSLIVYLLLFKVPQDGFWDVIKFQYSDKVFHAFIFAIMFVVWEKTSILSRLNDLNRVVVLSGSIFFFSVFMECMQEFSPYRSFEVLDIIANLFGLSTIMMMMLRLKKLRKNKRNFK